MNMKKFLTIFLVLMIAVAFALAITACKDEEEDDPQEEPQDWEDTVDLFETYTATVKGIALLPSEWNGVANKVATAINGAQGNATGAALGRFDTVFKDGDTVIIVEKTTVYKCKVDDGEFRTLYLSLNYLNDTGLQITITAATRVMALETDGGYQLE